MRYTGPSCRLCRREGVKLFLKGERCLTVKCGVARRPNTPGDAGANRSARRNISPYSVQLRTKQKMRRIYGISEKQFRRKYYTMAINQKEVAATTALPQIVERRLDNVVYKAGFAASRAQSRQGISHAHFSVNGKAVKTPSILVKVGDIIELRPKFKESILYKNHKIEPTTTWIKVDAKAYKAEIISLPIIEEVDFNDISPILELYSR